MATRPGVFAQDSDKPTATVRTVEGVSQSGETYCLNKLSPCPGREGNGFFFAKLRVANHH